VVIGGPPHSGKSVLTYSLTRALRARNVAHYVVRAYPPDYEGDWFLEGEQAWVRHLRIKGARSEAWLPLLQRDIARRHLPLIVDMGGLPTLDQEALMESCTHAILLTPDEASHATWQACMARHGLVLAANLHSDLNGENALHSTQPVIVGTLAGLDRGSCAQGQAFDALVDWMATLFGRWGPGLRRQHLESAPVELAVDLDRLAQHLGLEGRHWQPSDIPAVLNYLPEDQPLAIYGRGPNWLYAAIACYIHPAPFFLFDVRLGWVEAPLLRVGNPDPDAGLRVQRELRPDAVQLTFHVQDAYLDITEAETLRVPCTPERGTPERGTPERGTPGRGIILSGKLPHWLWAALVRACQAPWIAVFQPQVRGAVVVASDSAATPIGHVISDVT